MLEKLGITPGPWVEDTGCFYSEAQFNENGMTVEQPIAEMVGGRDEDYEANARLIAAAPELLEALIDLLDDWKYVEHHATTVQAIIEKATGKSWEEIKRLQEE